MSVRSAEAPTWAQKTVGSALSLWLVVFTLSNVNIQPAYAWDTCSSVATTPQGVCDHVCDGSSGPCSVINCSLGGPVGFENLHCQCFSVPESVVITGFTCYNYSACPAGTTQNTETGVCSQFYVAITPPPDAEPISCCTNSVGHPINPVTGAVFDTIADVSATDNSLLFKRFYNSTGSGNPDLSSGWRHSYSRHIQANYQFVTLQPYVASTNNSSLYDDPATACASGFAEIQARIRTWANALAAYSNGVCLLTQGGVSIGTVGLFSSVSLPAPGNNPVTFDVVRDDGQLIRFTVLNGAITAPPTINMKLQQTSAGYTLTDASDTIETYDTNGKLLTVASRAGVVQTMSYDTSGRLSGVTDSFGYQLSLSYDSQNRLITVTRQ